MPGVLTPPRAALGGSAVLMACACGTAANGAALIALAGVGATTTMVHPLFAGVAGALITYGLWRTAPRSGALALAAFAVLLAAAALTPPRVMTLSALPWTGTQVLGGMLYLVAAALLGYAFWRAFPSHEPAASGTAIGGAVLATGCTCCMFTGALAGLAVTGGASGTYFESMPLIFWSGMAIVAASLFRMGGWRAAAWVPVGAVVVDLGPDVLRLTGDWMWLGVNLRSFAQYPLTVVGAGLILYGFVVAYRGARPRAAAPAPAAPREPERESALVTA